MTSQRSADRETRWRFNVTVVCSDAGGCSSSTAVVLVVVVVVVAAAVFVCSDDGSPVPLTSYKSLAVYVTDDNDNRPTFTSQVTYVYTLNRCCSG